MTRRFKRECGRLAHPDIVSPASWKRIADMQLNMMTTTSGRQWGYIKILLRKLEDSGPTRNPLNEFR